jgi:hypothetical protein
MGQARGRGVSCEFINRGKQTRTVRSRLSSGIVRGCGGGIRDADRGGW